MAEDTLNNEDLLEGLSKDDIKPGLYEGGFKTWECSIDLARYLVTERQVISDLRSRPCHVIEVS